MEFNINTHLNLNYSSTTKQTYIDKYDKSVKIPFVKALLNHLPNARVHNADEIKPDESELAVSDNIELSSAVSGAAEVSGAGASGTTL